MEDRRTERRTNDARTGDTPPMTQRDAQREPMRDPQRDVQATRPGSGYSLVDRATMSEFERRWNNLQGDFVEDPRKAVGEAGSLLADLFDHAGKNLRQRRTEMDGNRSGEPDTEGLRQELRRYRSLMQRLLGEEPSTTTTAPRTTPPRTAD